MLMKAQVFKCCKTIYLKEKHYLLPVSFLSFFFLTWYILGATGQGGHLDHNKNLSFSASDHTEDLN